jgi:monofunctional chorismate mutase
MIPDAEESGFKPGQSSHSILNASRGVVQLEAIRNQIDQVDEEISELIGQRLDLVRQVAQVKEKYGLPTLDGDREKTVISRVLSHVKDPDLAKVVTVVYETLIRLCREHQNDQRTQSQSEKSI